MCVCVCVCARARARTFSVSRLAAEHEQGKQLQLKPKLGQMVSYFARHMRALPESSPEFRHMKESTSAKLSK